MTFALRHRCNTPQTEVWLQGLDLGRIQVLLQGQGFRVTHAAADLLQDNPPAGAYPSPIVLVSNARNAADERASIRALRAKYDAPLIVMVEAMTLTQLKAIIEAGATGYIALDVSADEFRRLATLVIEGEIVLP